MRCNFLILCEYAARLETGSPVLAGIFRTVHIPSLPGTIGTIVVACEVEVDPLDADRSHILDLVLSDEDGRPIHETQAEVHFERRPTWTPSYCYFSGTLKIETPIERTGAYRFDLIFNGESIGQARLDIITSL